MFINKVTVNLINFVKNFISIGKTQKMTLK
jgi:hypothetical protein